MIGDILFSSITKFCNDKANVFVAFASSAQKIPIMFNASGNPASSAFFRSSKPSAESVILPLLYAAKQLSPPYTNHQLTHISVYSLLPARFPALPLSGTIPSLHYNGASFYSVEFERDYEHKRPAERRQCVGFGEKGDCEQARQAE